MVLDSLVLKAQYRQKEVLLSLRYLEMMTVSAEAKGGQKDAQLYHLVVE